MGIEIVSTLGCLMFSNNNSLLRKVWGLSALLVVFLLSGTARAEQYLIRNDVPIPVVVQATCIFQGKVQQDRPHKLLPKAVTPPLMLAGSKVITVYDASNPTRILYRGKFPPSLLNLKLRITYDPLGRITLQRVP